MADAVYFEPTFRFEGTFNLSKLVKGKRDHQHDFTLFISSDRPGVVMAQNYKYLLLAPRAPQVVSLFFHK